MVGCCTIGLTFRSRRTASPPLNSSVRLQERFRVSGKSTPACRPRSASPWFLRLASGWPACVARGRWGSSSQLARVCSFAHPLRLSHARCVATSPLRQRFVCRTQALTIPRSCSAFGVALSSSKVVLRCRLTGRSRRTASPPLNSSVRPHEQRPQQCACSSWSAYRRLVRAARAQSAPSHLVVLPTHERFHGGLGITRNELKDHSCSIRERPCH
ncbi:hypothetical protein ABIE04_001792 [Rhodanobacter soli]|uniref:Uncharacterized protein n=1 Tax=Rhodanobacter soli TaxID=590609 RepID=A0ABV2PXK6_9GAMM